MRQWSRVNRELPEIMFTLVCISDELTADLSYEALLVTSIPTNHAARAYTTYLPNGEHLSVQ